MSYTFILVHNVEFIKLVMKSKIPSLEFWPLSPEAAIYILNNCSNYSQKTRNDIFSQKEHNFEVTIEFLKKNIPLKSDLLHFITSSEPDKLRFMYNYSNIIRKSINDYLENDEFLKAIIFNDIQRVKELQYKIDPNYCFKCKVSHFI